MKSRIADNRVTIAMAYLNEEHLETLIEQLEKVIDRGANHPCIREFVSIQVCTSTKRQARQAAIECIQNLVFCNLFNARPHAKRLHRVVMTGLFDETLEVRTAASTTLSGLYHCGYFQT